MQLIQQCVVVVSSLKGIDVPTLEHKAADRERAVLRLGIKEMLPSAHVLFCTAPRMLFGRGFKFTVSTRGRLMSQPATRCFPLSVWVKHNLAGANLECHFEKWQTFFIHIKNYLSRSLTTVWGGNYLMVTWERLEEGRKDLVKKQSSI